MVLPSPRTVITSLINSLGHSRADHECNSSLPESHQPTRDSSETLRKAFLTLQVLFPNELLPALDLLDRGLVTRLHLPDNEVDLPSGNLPQSGARDATPEDTHTSPSSGSRKKSTAPPPYLVRSSQYTSSSYASRHSNSTYHNNPSSTSDSSTTKTYLVYLTSWSCSCPAFAFAAFPATASSADNISAATGVDTEASSSLLPRQAPLATSSRNVPQSSTAAGTAIAGSKTSPAWRAGGLTRGEDVPMCKHLFACILAEVSKDGGGREGFLGEVEERGVSVEELAGWAAGWGD